MEFSPHGSTIRLAMSALLAAGLLAGVTGAPASAARLAPRATSRDIHLDPVLLTQVGSGEAVPAIFSWDPEATNRGELAGYLNANGIDAHLFSGASAGYACARSLATVRTLADAPGVRAVSADRELTPSLKKSVPTAFNGDPNAVWQGLGVTGKGVGIAVLDTGIDANHPDLAYGTRVRRNFRVLLAPHDHSNTNCPGIDYSTFSDDQADTELTSGHGTHIASVAAGDGTASGGKYRGLAPESYLIGMAVSDTVTPRTNDRQPDSTRMSTLGVMSAMEWIQTNAIESPNKVKVVLLGWTLHGVYDLYTNPISQYIDNLSSWGVTVVAPAGNDGPAQSDCSSATTCNYNLAGISPAIGVGAGPRGSRLTLEDYSSRGDPVTRYWYDLPARFEPTLVAPGSDVVAARHLGLAPVAPGGPDSLFPSEGGSPDRLTTDLDYQPLSGTSVAAAHVAGAVALMQQAAVDAKGCYLTVAQVREVLEATATPMPGYQRWEVGAGMIDVTAAVNYARFIPKVASYDLFMCPEPGQR